MHAWRNSHWTGCGPRTPTARSTQAVANTAANTSTRSKTRCEPAADTGLTHPEPLEDEDPHEVEDDRGHEQDRVDPVERAPVAREDRPHVLHAQVPLHERLGQVPE